jgi:hypothetical protein
LGLLRALTAASLGCLWTRSGRCAQHDSDADDAADDGAAQVYLLQQQLAAREQEVAALREIAEAASELQSQDVQAAKVIELSRKVRCVCCGVCALMSVGPHCRSLRQACMGD